MVRCLAGSLVAVAHLPFPSEIEMYMLATTNNAVQLCSRTMESAAAVCLV